MTKCISMTNSGRSSMKHPLKKTLLAMCVGAAIQPASWAQTESNEPATDGDVLEEVTVYGVRSSLKTAQDIKKNADTHVDAISASDLGALPDVSVLEALQRVPGVSIERFAAPTDPDHFSTEGSGVTLRGLPNTRSEFNGRDTFSADSGRGLSFQDVSPELLGSVEIFKNHTADMVEGGISGTINLNTRKPFDSEERILNFSAQANYGDLEGEVTPSISGLYSDRFEVSSGEVGVLLSYANSDLDFRSDGAQFGFHTQDDQGRFAPINAGIRTTSTNRKREGISAALQYENTDKTFSVLAEYISSDSDNNWLEYAFFSDDAGGSVGSDAVFSGNRFVGGTIEGVAGGLGPQTRAQTGNKQTEEFSLNFGFQPTERLALKADFQYVDSTTDVLDLSVFGGVVGGGTRILLSEADAPTVRFLAPQGSGQSDAEFFSDPNNYFWRAAMDHIEESEGDEVAVRLDAEYDLEMDFFKSVEVGARYSERDQTTRWSNYNWGNLSETWRGGVSTFAGSTNANGFQNDQTGAFSFGDFHNGNVGGLPGGTGIFADPSLVTSFDNFLAAFGGQRHVADLADRGQDGGFYTDAEINSTVEENTAFYARLNFGIDGERRLDGNVGLRYVNLDTTVTGGQTFPSITGLAAALLPADVVAFGNGFRDTRAAESSYDTVLPSLNIKYELNEDLIVRFAASKAISFPGLGNLRYNYNISSNIQTDADNNTATLRSFSQSSGNPFLKPLESTNIDLSLEYYFDDSDYVSLGVFHKDMKNFFSNNTVETLVTNPSNGVTQLVNINQPINIDDASLSGLEFSYQQFFDELPGIWSGLGMQFNFTYLDPSNVPQQNLRPEQSGSQSDADRAAVPDFDLPLQGLSETQYNIVGLFQNEKWEGRLAYNWRDDYLLTIREVNSPGSGPGVPTFADGRGQLDGSVFYTVNDSWQVGLQGSNLLQDEVVTSSLAEDGQTRVLRHSFIYDRRFTFVVRGQF
ncbi:TonB-dependent receptor [Arenicella sp. 4NH20-0111]